ncbi:MAG: sulfotransferase [Candidatus Neomarinimicrobiota bacterium]|nr:sulfotransferase [Candidatus Neomarinimicrobiota bacterium]
MNEPILITGSHRSGTTWVGNIIRNLPRIYYLHEPLTPNSITRGLFNTEIWYKYYDPKKEYENIETILNELFSGSYPFKAMFHFKNSLPHTDYRNPNGINDGKIDLKYFKWRINAYIDSKRLNKKEIIPLIKDPIALTAAEWIYHKWNSKNVILIRHPAAFVSSLIRLNWRFNFENFTKQPDLIDRFLGPYRSQINNPPKDFISEASLIWTCITKIIIEYQKLYPNWLYIRHEDLSYDPINEFELLFKRLELSFSNKVKRFIQSTSSHSNPSEVSKKTKVHQLQRDSRKNIKNWKKRLSKDEIKLIRDKTEHLSNKFYLDKDW